MEAGNKKKIIIAIVAIVLLIVTYLWWKNKSQKDQSTDTSNSDTEKTPSPLTADDTMSVFPLKMGSRNTQVKNLQAYLLKNEGSQIKVDGIWGNETDSAVKKYLKLDNISKDKYASLGLK